jgi:hypothetical protein
MQAVLNASDPAHDLGLSEPVIPLQLCNHNHVQGQHRGSSGAPGAPEDERADQGTLSCLRS